MSATARLVIGIDVGGTKALAGLVDDAHAILKTSRQPTHGVDTAGLMAILEAEVAELRTVAEGEVVGIGLGIPALLDREGRAWQAPNLPIDHGYSIGAELARRTGLPVASDNDANVAALYEHRAGAGVGHDDLVMLTIGTGVGGGVILGGRPMRGAHGMAAELGHLVIDRNGPPCIGDCPNHGCLEALASGSALVIEATKLAEANPGSALGTALAEGTLDGPRVTELAEGGDELARAALTTIGTALGVGLSSLANIFDPGLFLIGGGASAAGEMLLGPARSEFERRAMPPIVERTEVKLASAGNDAGLLGAAILAHDAVEHGDRSGTAIARPGAPDSTEGP